jgi:hypothetical protein
MSKILENRYVISIILSVLTLVVICLAYIYWQSDLLIFLKGFNRLLLLVVLFWVSVLTIIYLLAKNKDFKIGVLYAFVFFLITISFIVFKYLL